MSSSSESLSRGIINHCRFMVAAKTTGEEENEAISIQSIHYASEYHNLSVGRSSLEKFYALRLFLSHLITDFL
jgi:hypothetical protein